LFIKLCTKPLLIDYEFNLYHQLLLKYNCNSEVEIGCGTGNLAQRFTKNSIEYIGIDISDDMLAIAKKESSSRYSFIYIYAGFCFKKSGVLSNYYRENL
jgi:SAM-dependent methyltransferase